MIHLHNYLTTKYFFLFLILVYSFLILIIILKKTIYQKLSLDDYKKSSKLLIDYLDKYYIKNKFITFTCFLFYLFLKISSVLYMRYLYLGHEMHLTKFLYEANTLSPFLLLKFLLFLFVLIICIRLFYFLIYKIFFDEILKVYIYIYENKWFSFITSKLRTVYAQDIFGPCYLFFECIYRKTPIPNDFFYNEYYIYNDIYKYDLIKKLTIIMINLSQKYQIIFIFIKICRKLCHLLYVHFNNENISKYFPWCLLIITFFYDFFNLNIYYTYYMLFICYFLSLYNNFYDFLGQFESVLISRLNIFFYKNSIDYSKQRIFINNRLILSSTTKENNSLLYTLNYPDTIEHIYYNFKEKKQYEIKIRIMNLRFYTIILLSVLVMYLIYLIINNKIICDYHSFILLGSISFLWLLTIFYGKNTYTLEKEDPNDNTFPSYIYNKKYEIMFWLLLILQSYIFWKLLFKPEIILMTNEILLQIPFDLLKISKVYSNEDKIIYLFSYFEHRVNYINISIDVDYLRHLLRQIDFNELISKDHNLKDLQGYVEMLFTSSEALEIFIKDFCEKYIIKLSIWENDFLSDYHEEQHSYSKLFSSFLDFILFIVLDYIITYKQPPTNKIKYPKT